MSVSYPKPHAATQERHRFTVEEYFRLADVGALPGRTELIEGDIYDMSAHSPRHRAAVKIVADTFEEALADLVTVFVQSTVAFEGWSPEPDVMVLAYDPQLYNDRQPSAEEIFLVVEVADTTLAKDKGIKLRNYARQGVREYWVVNLVDAVIEVYYRPQNEDYEVKMTYRFDEAFAPAGFPERSRVWLTF